VQRSTALGLNTYQRHQQQHRVSWPVWLANWRTSCLVGRLVDWLTGWLVGWHTQLLPWLAWLATFFYEGSREWKNFIQTEGKLRPLPLFLVVGHTRMAQVAAAFAGALGKIV